MMNNIVRLQRKIEPVTIPQPELCVQLKDNRPWCPKRKWYMMDGCPFSCRNECNIYEEMCGAL